MKKSLLAVAVLGAMSGAAFAQVAPNNITLYGIADVGFQTTKTDNGTTSSRVTGINSGIQSGSRWGFRGSEDLGGGLKANFNLEAGYTIDNGNVANGATMFGRAAWAGLSGGFGEIRMGRMTIFSSSVAYNADPFGGGFGQAVWGLSQAGATKRNDNTITYLTPNMSGLQGAVYYSFGEVASPVPANTAKNNWLGLGVTYAAGPLFLGLAYDSVDTSTNTNRDEKWLNLAASYNFGIATVRFGYVDEERANRVDRTGFVLGANVPLAGGQVMASYQDGEDKQTGVATIDYTRYAIGYTYPLSRRTNVYTAYANQKDKQSGAATIKRNQFSLGIRHTF